MYYSLGYSELKLTPLRYREDYRLPTNLQKCKMVLDVLFVLHNEGLKVHNCTCICFGSEGRFSQKVLWNVIEEVRHFLIVNAFGA